MNIRYGGPAWWGSGELLVLIEDVKRFYGTHVRLNLLRNPFARSGVQPGRVVHGALERQGWCPGCGGESLVFVGRCVASNHLHLLGPHASFYSTSKFTTCCTPAHYCALLHSNLFDMLSLRQMARDTPSLYALEPGPKPDQTSAEGKTNVNDCLPCRAMGILLRPSPSLVFMRVA